MLIMRISTSRLLAAKDWLDQHLPPGSVAEAGKMLRLARHAGHRESTIKLARWALGIASRKGRGRINPPWLWQR